MVYEAVNKPEQSIGFFESAYSMRPTEPEFIANLARARLRLDADDPAVKPLLEELILHDSRPIGCSCADLLGRQAVSDYQESELVPTSPQSEEPLPPPTMDDDLPLGVS